jgi:hypothetical protein
MIRPSIQKENEKEKARDKDQDMAQLVQRSVLRDLSWRISNVSQTIQDEILLLRENK